MHFCIIGERDKIKRAILVKIEETPVNTIRMNVNSQLYLLRQFAQFFLHCICVIMHYSSSNRFISANECTNNDGFYSIYGRIKRYLAVYKIQKLKTLEPVSSSGDTDILISSFFRVFIFYEVYKIEEVASQKLIMELSCNLKASIKETKCSFKRNGMLFRK